MSQLLTDLLAVRELLSVPERWNKGFGARNSKGEAVSSLSPTACAWCLKGACAQVTGIEYSVVGDRFDRLIVSIRMVCGYFVSDFNDAPGRTHAEVLALIDKAIETERAAA